MSDLVAGVVIGLGTPVLAYVVGLFLPEDYERAVAIRFQRSNEAIWEALDDPRAHPFSGEGVQAVEPLPDPDSGRSWVEVSRDGALTVRTLEFELGRRLVRRIEDQERPVRVLLEIELEPTPWGFRVTARTRTRIERGSGMRGSWMTPYLRLVTAITGGPARETRRWLAGIARALDQKVRFESPATSLSG